MILGTLNLNLFNCPAEVYGHLCSSLAQLMPVTVGEIMSLQNLNDKSYIPRQNSEGELVTGLLQLPFGTSLLLDETALQPGQLRETGIMHDTNFRQQYLIQF